MRRPSILIVCARVRCGAKACPIVNTVLLFTSSRPRSDTGVRCHRGFLP
jgi:hypothetical protein